MTEKVEFHVLRVSYGYNHSTVEGYYTGPATVKDVEDRFYHEYFGGRSAAIDNRNKTFSCIVHGCD